MITGKYSELSRHSRLLASVATCVLSAASAVASPASSGPTYLSAASASDANAVRVSYRDLNLATDEGNRVLYQRITRAARRVCGVGDSRDLDVVAYSRACERNAVSQAVHTVNSARLAAIDARLQPRG